VLKLLLLNAMKNVLNEELEEMKKGNRSMLNMFLMKLMMVSHDKRQLPPLPVDDSSNSDEVVDADDQKQRKQEARFAKVLSTSMSNSLRLNSKSLSRASLPKFDYASQIKVSEKTFPQ
jgi:hypothetical protein